MWSDRPSLICIHETTSCLCMNKVTRKVCRNFGQCTNHVVFARSDQEIRSPIIVIRSSVMNPESSSPHRGLEQPRVSDNGHRRCQRQVAVEKNGKPTGSVPWRIALVGGRRSVQPRAQGQCGRCARSQQGRAVH